MANGNPILQQVDKANQQSRAQERVELPAETQAGLDKAKIAINEVITQQEELYAQIPQIEADLTANAHARVAAEQAITLQTETAKLEQQRQVQEAARSLDAKNNLSNIYSELNRIQDELIADTQHLDKVMDTDITGIGIIDNKLKEVKTRQLRANIERNTQAQQQLSQSAAVTSKAIEEASSMAGHMSTKVTEATINANLDKQRLLIDRQLITDNLSLMSTQGQMLSRIESANSSALGVILKEQQLRETLLRTANEEDRSAVLKAQLDSITDEKQREENWKQLVNQGRKLRGEVPYTDESLDIYYNDMFVKGRKLPQEVGVAWEAGSLNQFATTPEEAMQYRVNNNAIPNQFLGMYMDEAIQDANPKKGESKIEAAARELKNRLARDFKSIEDGDTNNAAIAPGNEAVTRNSEVVATPLWQKSVMIAQSDVTKHSKLISDAYEALTRGDITSAEFDEGIATVYRTARAQVNTLLDVNSIGIDNPKGYRAKVRFPSPSKSQFFGAGNTITTGIVGQKFISSQVFDLTNPADIARIRVKFQIARGLGEE